MSAASKQEEKNKKKLKYFFDKNSSLSKRWKSLLSFAEKATPDEIHRFCNENFYMIYGVFWDSFSLYEAGCKKGKHSNTEVNDFCLVLQLILDHLSELIRKKWQTRSIATVLEHLLYKENKINIRLKGLELLLLFIEDVQDLEPSQLDLFAASIDFGGFCTGIHQGVRLKAVPLSAPDKGSILLPSVNAGNLENVVALWDSLLQAITTKANQFSFWLELMKKEFFSVCYPKMALRTEIIQTNDVGFLSYCPAPLQAKNVSHLDTWLKNTEISAILWSTEQNVELVLEILRQSCSLPISEAATIRDTVKLMKYIFLGNYEFSDSVRSRLPEFRRFFFQQLSCIFDIVPSKNEATEHVSLCLEIIEEMRSIYLSSYTILELTSQETLLNTLLQITVNVFTRPSMVQPLSGKLLDTIYFIWIKTGRNSESMWRTLQDQISSLFTFLEPVKELKIKLIQLTLIIAKKIFPPPGRKSGRKAAVPRAANFETIKKDVSPSVSLDNKVPLPSIPIDANISSIDWTLDDLVYVWQQLLLVLDSVNTIRDPVIHSEAIQTFSDIIEILQQGDESVGVKEREEMIHAPLNLLNIFGSWMFEASLLSSPTMLLGKSIAIGTLCRMIVRHHGDTTPLELLSHFYGALHHCLTTNPDSIVSHAILQNSSNIFNLALPGAAVMIPGYIAEIKKIQKSSSTPPSISLRSIIIIASLICYPSHLKGLSCPLDIATGSGNFEFSTTLKDDIVSVLRSYCSSIREKEEHITMCIWISCSLIFEDLFGDAPDIQLVNGIVKSLFPLCIHSSIVIAKSALDCFSTLAQISEKIQKLDPSLLSMMVSVLCSNITLLFKEQAIPTGRNEDLIACHFYTLLDYFMCNSSHIMNDIKLASTLFGAIEKGLLGQPATQDLPGVPKKGKTQRDSVLISMTPEEKFQLLLDSLMKNPTHESQTVRESAHILLTQLCNFYQTFPSPEGVSVISSVIDESEEGSEPMFFISNNFALFSVSEMTHPDSGHPTVRLMLRDCTGRYAWDTSMNHSGCGGEIEVVPSYSLEMEPITPPTIFDVENPTPSGRLVGEPPLNIKDDRMKVEGLCVDQMNDLLCFLSETSPDCLLSPLKPLNEPVDLRPEFREAITLVQSALMDQEQCDLQGISEAREELSATQYQRIPHSPILHIESDKHRACRTLLTNMGFLSFEKRDSFYMVEDNQRFRRSLTQLDKTSGREMSKIGVIYVKEGQDNQKIILRNDSKSPLYQEFISGLGWEIDIASHQGYLGGLDRKLTTGKTAPYFANYLFEVAFHEITSMPTNPTDAQQIHKKRHVGNDIVHIVYSEHTSDYKPTTITSQFNDAHVVVYPLPNGLFRVQIYRKDKVPVFGPLVHGMCINKTLLPTLVRLTAIHANRLVRLNTGGYSRPFPTRKRALDEIMTRFKNETSYENVIVKLSN